MARRSSLRRMLADDRVVDVHVRIRVGSVEQLDAIAAARGLSRSAVLREAVTWFIAREAAWSVRRADVAEQRRHQDEVLAQALARNPALADDL